MVATQDSPNLQMMMAQTSHSKTVVLESVLSFDVGRTGAAALVSAPPHYLDTGLPIVDMIVVWKTYTRKDKPVTVTKAYRGGEPMEDRVWGYSQVVDFIPECMYQRSTVVIEDTYGTRNISTVKVLSRMCGEIEGALCRQIGREYEFIYASVWRSQLLSVPSNMKRNDAKKHTMDRIPHMIYNWNEYKDRFESRFHEHILDAIGLALYTLKRESNR